MTDADTTAPLPDEIATVLDKATFDTKSWLAGASYATASVEVYTNGELLAELAELVEFVKTQKAEEDRQKRNLTHDPMGITDESTIDEALSAIANIRQALKGTGATFHFRGIAPEVRKVMRKRIARELKPTKFSPATETTEAVEAIPGGEDHPDFGKKFEYELIAKSLQFVEFPGGGRDDHRHTAEEIAAFDGQLEDSEYLRMANKAYEANFHSYNIDELINSDFS